MSPSRRSCEMNALRSGKRISSTRETYHFVQIYSFNRFRGTIKRTRAHAVLFTYATCVDGGFTLQDQWRYLQS
jgi:hypothetical protein